MEFIRSTPTEEERYRTLAMRTGIAAEHLRALFLEGWSFHEPHQAGFYWMSPEQERWHWADVRSYVQGRFIMADNQNLHLTTDTESTTLWPEVAVKAVEDWAKLGLGVPADASFYMVWFSYTLGNWKALVSSTESDGRYYEVTFNIKQNEMYVDTYVKTHNHVVKITTEKD